jgi:hypothetical protein
MVQYHCQVVMAMEVAGMGSSCSNGFNVPGESNSETT